MVQARGSSPVENVVWVAQSAGAGPMTRGWRSSEPTFMGTYYREEEHALGELLEGMTLASNRFAVTIPTAPIST